MSGSDFKENRNNDYPRITEADWYALAISLAIMTFVIATGGLLWIFYAAGTEELQKRLAITGMVTTFLGATTTFCTVAWRGMITSKQSETSIEQVKETRRQIAITEDNNLALLLQKGAEFLSDDNPTKKSAGISLLSTVMNSGQENFSSVSQSLLVDYVERDGKYAHNSSLIQQSISAINSYYDKYNRILYRSVLFDAGAYNGPYDPYHFFMLIYGVERVFYIGGIINNHRNLFLNKNFIFRNVVFNSCKFTSETSAVYEKCIFNHCEFNFVNSFALRENTFKNCNFSNCKIAVIGDIPQLVDGGNYYEEDAEPVVNGEAILMDWEAFFVKVPK